MLSRAWLAGPAGSMKSTCSGLAVFCRPTHVEGAVFQQSNEAASEAQEIRCPQRKLLQELIQLADGAEFGRNIQQLMEFVGLGAGGVVKLGIGDGHRREAGDH